MHIPIAILDKLGQVSVVCGRVSWLYVIVSNDLLLKSLVVFCSVYYFVVIVLFIYTIKFVDMGRVSNHLPKLSRHICRSSYSLVKIRTVVACITVSIACGIQ